jgi:uncharacterized membrane protein YgcG
MDSDSTMSQSERISTLRRRRDALLSLLRRVDRQIDEWEEAGATDQGFITSRRQTIDKLGNMITNTQIELDELGDPETEHAEATQHEHIRIRGRITKLVKQSQYTTNSTPQKCEPSNRSESTSLKFPDIKLPKFDGTLEEWTSFYETFSSVIDQNKILSPVQKFLYLRTSLVGQAARSIQLLDLTASNYPIAMDVLKERFDCQRRICMHHWYLIRDYPRIPVETPEAIDDFLETVKLNLHALEKLGQNLIADVILIDLFITKLPASTIRMWHHTLPDGKMPSYTHLLEFLKTRANRDRLDASVDTKGASHRRLHHRQKPPREHTFTTTEHAPRCPICQGHHGIKKCKAFKAEPVKRRIELVKEASLCVNCLSSGHSRAHCPSGLCRRCRHRHHTLLHQDKPQNRSSTLYVRSSSGRSSSGRSSSGQSPSGHSSSGQSSSGHSSSGGSLNRRFSSRHSSNGQPPKGRSPTGSPTSRPHQSRRTTNSTRKPSPAPPKDKKSTYHYESRTTRSRAKESQGSSNPRGSKSNSLISEIF